MPDVFTPEKRSAVMARIRGKGNKDTELRLMEIFRENGITGWRRNTAVFGKPDFVFRKERLAVFVDGCFWHGCPKHCRMPAGNAEANSLFLSDVSCWEIALKFTAKKLPLPLSPSVWVPSRRSFFGIEVLPLSETAIFWTCELPTVHQDFFDRLLAAQALEGDLTILSPDLKLDLLGAKRVW